MMQLESTNKKSEMYPCPAPNCNHPAAADKAFFRYDFSHINIYADAQGTDKTNEVVNWVFAEHQPYFRLCEFFRRSRIDMIKDFLDKIAEQRLVCVCCGNGLLHMAVLINSNEIVRLVLSRSTDEIDVNAKNENGETALHLACGNGCLSIIQLLLTARANPNCVDDAGSLPLHISLARCEFEAVKLLLSQGARARGCLTPSDCWTPLHLAVQKRSGPMIDLLLRHGADLEAQDRHGKSPLYLAVEMGDQPLVEKLLKSGANVGTVCKAGRSLLHAACAKGHPECVRKLLDSGVNVNAVDFNGNHVLHDAVRSRMQVIVEELTKRGSYVNILDRRMQTPLCLAVLFNEPRMIERLLRYGAAVEPAAMALLQIARLGLSDIVKMLVERGLSVDTADQHGRSLLHAAIKTNDVRLVRFLADKGVNVQVCGDFNGPIISDAICQGNIEIVRILLEKGANVCSCDTLGRTPMFNAMRYNQFKIVKMLQETRIECVIKSIPIYEEFLRLLRNGKVTESDIRKFKWPAAQ